MTWMLLGLASALFLGFYDICKKGALKDNAVLPVLFWATFCGSLTTLPFLLISRFLPDLLQSSDFFVHQLPLTTNLLILLKSVIVGSSWICAYYSLKHLPISIVAPIRSSSPFWALIGAIIIYGENPSYMQFFGIAVVLVSFYAFSLVGKLESIHFPWQVDLAYNSSHPAWHLQWPLRQTPSPATANPQNNTSGLVLHLPNPIYRAGDLFSMVP